jgi:hypothetical protein
MKNGWYRASAQALQHREQYKGHQMNTPTTQRNIDTIRAWLDAHNRQDMKAH